MLSWTMTSTSPFPSNPSLQQKGRSSSKCTNAAARPIRTLNRNPSESSFLGNWSFLTVKPSSLYATYSLPWLRLSPKLMKYPKRLSTSNLGYLSMQERTACRLGLEGCWEIAAFSWERAKADFGRRKPNQRC